MDADVSHDSLSRESSSPAFKTSARESTLAADNFAALEAASCKFPVMSPSRTSADLLTVSTMKGTLGAHRNVLKDTLETLKNLLELIEVDISLRDLYLTLVLSICTFTMYLAVMYLQYQDMGGFEMVSTTTKALVPPINAPFMLWLKTQIMKVWIDPECGDGICDSPYEFPSFGRFGCQADCSAATDTRDVLIYLEADFDNLNIESAQLKEDLSKRVRWNVCSKSNGLPVVCWFEKDQRLDGLKVRQIEKFSLTPGEWHVRVSGDPTTTVRGRVMDSSNSTQYSYMTPITR
ncbi:hypothetical protein CYMTET_22988 [Cymbomonas tetramitiformis]|uniref:Uncharacterized protein n=1 Tax=Cymbomonas tetramitiformis TaxID=36881 RepID=A0AAE0L1D7_9CHLO|nr:hypothetical protein CYMTET_22988 [Cymbomonas tetramitiformis]